jgi:Fe2+ transport system protein FeoA
MAPDVTCALCGLEFDPGDATCAHGCPLSSVCGLVECPSCQYEFPKPAEGRKHAAWRGRKRSAPAACPEGVRSVLDMAPGESASVVCFTDGRETRHNTLAVFGLVPGAELRLLQQRSSPVIQVGETALALDREIAASIIVSGSAKAVAQDSKDGDTGASARGRVGSSRIVRLWTKTRASFARAIS